MNSQGAAFLQLYEEVINIHGLMDKKTSSVWSVRLIATEMWHKQKDKFRKTEFIQFNEAVQCILNQYTWS